MSPLGKSDHCVLSFVYCIKCQLCTYKVKRYFYDRGDYEGIKKELHNTDWNFLFTDQNVQ